MGMAKTKNKNLPTGVTRLPSGNYRVRKMFKGVQVDAVVDYMPKKSDIDSLCMEAVENSVIPHGVRSMTFNTAAEQFLKAKNGVLSPSTLRAYHSYLKTLPSAFTGKILGKIRQSDLDVMVGGMNKDKKPKYVRNLYGFVTSVIHYHAPDMQFSTRLPQWTEPEYFAPEEDDVKRIMEWMKDTKCYVPFALAVMGLRKSEILALTVDDLDENDMLTINKAKVRSPEGTYVIKHSPKNRSSVRTIQLPKSVADIIREQGYIHNGGINMMNRQLAKAQKELGIEHFRLHDMRHYFVSQGASMHVPDKYVQQIGGWKTDFVMKRRYLQVQKSQVLKQGNKYLKHLEQMF